MKYLALIIALAFLPASQAADRFTNNYKVRVLQGSGTAIRGVGATRVAKYVQGLYSLGLWSTSTAWTLRSAQNAGTGTTVYSFGGLSQLNGTATNGPSWGVNGMAFVAGSSQYVSIPNAFLNDAGSIGGVFSCVNPASITSNPIVFGTRPAAGNFGFIRDYATSNARCAILGGSAPTVTVAGQAAGSYRLAGLARSGLNLRVFEGSSTATILGDGFNPSVTNEFWIGRQTSVYLTGTVSIILVIEGIELTPALWASLSALYISTIGQGLGL